MTREELVQLAVQAGFHANEEWKQGSNLWNEIYDPNSNNEWPITELVERFAKLIAAHERNECAKVVMSYDTRLDAMTGIYKHLSSAILNRWEK